MLRCLGLRRFTAAGSARAGCLSQMPQTETAQKRQSEHCAKCISTLKGRVGVSFLVCVMIAKLHCQRKPRTTNLNWSTAPHESRRNRRSCCQAAAGSTPGASACPAAPEADRDSTTVVKKLSGGNQFHPFTFVSLDGWGFYL